MKTLTIILATLAIVMSMASTTPAEEVYIQSGRGSSMLDIQRYGDGTVEIYDIGRGRTIVGTPEGKGYYYREIGGDIQNDTYIEGNSPYLPLLPGGDD